MKSVFKLVRPFSRKKTREVQWKSTFSEHLLCGITFTDGTNIFYYLGILIDIIKIF